MTTLYNKDVRNIYYTDIDGFPSTYKEEDSVRSYTIDWSDEIGSDTISSSSWETDGVTEDSSSNTTTTTTITVSSTGGEAKNTVVTAGGDTLIKRIRFDDPYHGRVRHDYGK